MVEINNLLRENIKRLKPYSTARDEYTGEIGVFLDANENAFGAIGTSGLNRYPDPHQKEIKEKLAAIKRVQTNNIFIGNGSDEAIDLLFRAFCNPGKDSVIIMPPTYGMYKVSAEINDVEIVEVPLTNKFDIATEEVLTAITERTKIIFVCSPNNPTGNLLNKDAVKKLITSFNGIIAVDEAYIDFANSESWISELKNYNNLVVLQTFSKAWGLANIRVGLAFADSEIISALNKIKYPYNINGVSQQIILTALSNVGKKNEVVKKIIAQKNIMQNELLKFDFIETLFPSDANFVLAKVKDAEKIYNYLLDRKIIIRNRSNMIHCKECLRFTVGTEEENRLLIDALINYKNK